MKLAKKLKFETPITKATLLSEAESSAIAGVTEETLRSYTEFGLLKPVFRNQKPFYRQLELSKLFNIKLTPTLEALLDEDLVEKSQTNKEVVEEEASAQEIKEPELKVFQSPQESSETQEDEEKIKVKKEKNSLEFDKKELDKNYSNEFLPAIRTEDILIVNKELKTKVISLENERDWLRDRIEQLEQRSAREQMLLLKEKETLREVLNATVIKNEENKKFVFLDFFKSLPFFRKD